MDGAGAGEIQGQKVPGKSRSEVWYQGMPGMENRMMPQRIQRKRTKGWRMPADAVYVGRGTVHGNPYKIEGYLTRELVVSLFRTHMQRMKQNHPDNFDAMLAPLRGKKLACWCHPEKICHADVWIEFLTEEGKSDVEMLAS